MWALVGQETCPARAGNTKAQSCLQLSLTSYSQRSQPHCHTAVDRLIGYAWTPRGAHRRLARNQIHKLSQYNPVASPRSRVTRSCATKKRRPPGPNPTKKRQPRHPRGSHPTLIKSVRGLRVAPAQVDLVDGRQRLLVQRHLKGLDVLLELRGRGAGRAGGVGSKKGLLT